MARAFDDRSGGHRLLGGVVRPVQAAEPDPRAAGRCGRRPVGAREDRRRQQSAARGCRRSSGDSRRSRPSSADASSVQFTGALPEAQVRQWLDDLIALAAEGGIGAEERAEWRPARRRYGDRNRRSSRPRLCRRLDALERGDLDAAASAYRDLLAARPDDPGADGPRAGRAGPAQPGPRRRNRPRGRRQRARRHRRACHERRTSSSSAVASRRRCRRLVTLVGRSSGDDREQARTHLLELFTVLGAEDPRVSAARRNLMAVLF